MWAAFRSPNADEWSTCCPSGQPPSRREHDLGARDFHFRQLLTN